MLPRGIPGYYLEHLEQVAVRNCSLSWQGSLPDYFSHAVEVVDCADLQLEYFQGEAAFPGLLAQIKQ